MTMPATVLVVAPLGADARNIGTVLRRAKLGPRICASIEDAAGRIADDIGALVITEEALSRGQHAALAATLARQPPWSDLPIVVVTTAASLHRWAAHSVRLLGAHSNPTLIARPLRAETLVAAVNAVLRARARQYELRDLLRERDTLLGSLEERVQERTAKLQELLAELESFSYSVSHDLRAPLRVMAGYAKALIEDHGATLNPQARQYVERIAYSAERMDALTQDVLTYTRLSRGEITLEPVDLEQMLRQLFHEYPALAATQGALTLRKPLASVIAHGPSLVQVLANLIGNAVKFARPGVPLRVKAFTQRRGDRVRIVVKDNGRGVDAALHEKIFGMFERGVGPDIPGTGIGLAIVKKAAERMSGSVGVSSKLGAGAEFWIELPRAPALSGQARV